MIDGLKLTIPGDKLRLLLEAQIERHEQRAARWAREQTQTPEDATTSKPAKRTVSLHPISNSVSYCPGRRSG